MKVVIDYYFALFLSYNNKVYIVVFFVVVLLLVISQCNNIASGKSGDVRVWMMRVLLFFISIWNIKLSLEVYWKQERVLICRKVSSLTEPLYWPHGTWLSWPQYKLSVFSIPQFRYYTCLSRLFPSLKENGYRKIRVKLIKLIKFLMLFSIF